MWTGREVQGAKSQDQEKREKKKESRKEGWRTGRMEEIVQ